MLSCLPVQVLIFIVVVVDDDAVGGPRYDWLVG